MPNVRPERPTTAPANAPPLALPCTAIWVIATAAAGQFGIWLAVGGAAVALGLAVLLLDRPAARPMLRPSPRLVLLGAAAGALMAASTYALYPLLAHIAPFSGPDTAALYVAFRAPSQALASLALPPIILGEELVWRGVVQTALARRFGPWAGATLAAVVYALAHAPLGSTVLVMVAFLCGIAWGALRAATASLIPAVVAHLLWDAVVLLWLPLA